MKKKLILLGNGFDVSCGLKSRYSDFLEDLKRKENLEDKSLNIHNCLYVKAEMGTYYDWKDVEERYKQLIQAVNDMSLGNNDIQKIRYVENLNKDLNDFKKELKDYLNKEIENVSFKDRVSLFFKELLKDSEIDIICYNYTDTIQQIINAINEDIKDNDKISPLENYKIYNIHGSLNSDDIVVGHNITCMDNQILVKGSQINNKEIQRNNDFTKKLETDYDELHIIGCSIVGTDYDDIIRYISKSRTIYIYDYKHDSDDKIEYIKNRQKTEGIIEKIKIISYPKIFIDKEDMLSLKQEKFLLDLFNIRLEEVEGISIPKTLEGLLDTINVNELNIKLNRINDANYNMLIEVLKKLKLKEKSFILEAEINVEKEQKIEFNKKIKEILNEAGEIFNMTIKSISLEYEIFEKVCSLKINSLNFENIKLEDVKTNSNLSINNNIRIIDLDTVIVDDDNIITLEIKNSIVENIKFKRIEKINIKLEELNSLINLDLDNGDENIENLNVGLSGKFYSLRNLKIKTNDLLLEDVKIDKNIIEKIEVEANDYTALNIFEAFEEDLYFKKLRKLEFLFKNIEEEKYRFPFFATQNKATVSIKGENEPYGYGKKGRIFERIKGNEILENNHEKKFEEKSMENVIQHKKSNEKIMSTVFRKMNLLDEEECKTYAKNKNIDEEKFIRLAKKQFNGEISKSQANLYEGLIDLKFPKNKEFTKETYEFVNSLFNNKGEIK